MSTDPTTSANLCSTSVCAVLNLIAAAIWFLIGVVTLGLCALSVHDSDQLVPLVLLGGSGLLFFSGVALLLPGPGGRPSILAILALALAAACGLSYVALCYTRKFGDFQAPDPGTLVIGIFPGVIALLVVGEVLYLCVERFSPRPTEPGDAAD